MTAQVLITKASGDKEVFLEEKLRESLRRCGASAENIDKVAEHIRGELKDGMTTNHIYRHAFFVLRKIENPDVIRKYSLRRALLEFGPTGFPFEKFISAIFKDKGFESEVNQIVHGKCVMHEIDVVAYNENKLIMVESKFHNQLGEKTDLKVALYVKARFEDLSTQTFFYGKRRPLDEGWLVTNTKFTESAIVYGECAKLKMVGWNYPKRGNLEQMIEDTGLHPITCLGTLNLQDRQLLLNHGVVLCKQVKGLPDILESAGIEKEKIGRIQAEADTVCRVYGS